MKIDHIKLKNYRCFDEFQIDLNDRFTLLVGNNASGKSTILDSLAVALGSFFIGMDGGSPRSISKNDARLETYEIGSRLDRQAQFPVRVECCGTLNNQQISWARSLDSEKGRTKTTEASDLTEISTQLATQVRTGDSSVILPILSYYGTGRLWAKKKEKSESTQVNLTNRNSGYADCLDAMNNDKLMNKWFEQMTYIELQERKEMPELSVVKKAILLCFNGEEQSSTLGKATQCIYNVKSGEIEITYTKNNGESEILTVSQMSDGYRNMLSMVADIAYRMAVLNPQLLDRVIEETEGVVLIDEIDLHLHPSWQRHVVADLQRIFPKVQFIATTHAPSVIASVEKEHVILLQDHKAFPAHSSTYGKDVNTILKIIMGVDERPGAVKHLISKFYNALGDEQYSNASTLLNELSDILEHDDPEVVSAKIALELETME